MSVRVHSACVQGMEGISVQVEVDIAPGLPAFDIVGLPDHAVQESKQRVRAAIKNSAAAFPLNRKVVNLAPAHVRKHGPMYDLPIAVGILAAAQQIQKSGLEKSLFIGELSLDGVLQPARGILPLVMHAKRAGFRAVYIPAHNFEEASRIHGIHVYPLSNLQQLIKHLRDNEPIEEPKHTQTKNVPEKQKIFIPKGQGIGKNALEIAVAGHHHLIYCGLPGVGKTLLAKMAPLLLPPLSDEEEFEVNVLHSIKGLQDYSRTRPFRAVHHSVSHIGLVGGGHEVMPGEISMAHQGVLFLDEIAEFPRSTIELLRQPLEEKKITIQRSKGNYTFPANFLLIGTMNPCPCGYYGSQKKKCLCSESALDKYHNKLSGPFLDRIDLFSEMEEVSTLELMESTPENFDDKIQRIKIARAMQEERFHGKAVKWNGELGPEDMHLIGPLDIAAKEQIHKAAESYEFSARKVHKILKIARTIADLRSSEKIKPEHIASACTYKNFRNYTSAANL